MVTFDTALFRKTAGSFASGVTVVTTGTGDRLRGFTASAFTSLSLDPPLVLVCIDRRALTLPVLQETGAFAINILGREQEHFSTRFSTREIPDSERMIGIDHQAGLTGVPVLADAVATFECRLWQQYDGGDHVIAIGEVLNLSALDECDPLLYFRGRYRRFAELAPV